MAPHVLLVGGYPKAHEQLQRLGCRLSLLVPLRKFRAVTQPQLYERVVAMPNAAPEAEWVEQAALIHRLDPLTALGGFAEPEQEHAAAIAATLRLPYHSAAAVRATRFKDRMRAILAAADIDPTAGLPVADATAIATFGERHGYPLVLKPVDGTASVGVSRINRPEEIDPAVAWLRERAPESAMLVEQFLFGTEISVEMFSEQGAHQLLATTAKHKASPHFVEIGHCVPAQLDPATLTAVERVVGAALTALGIADGPSHTEVMLTASGPRVVETHARMGGDCIDELITLSSGLDPVELWARQVLGEQVLDRTASNAHQRGAAIWYAALTAEGTVERVDGAAQALAIPGVVGVHITSPPGSVLHGTHDSHGRAAYAIAVGATGDEALALARQAIQQLTFVIACRESV